MNVKQNKNKKFKKEPSAPKSITMEGKTVNDAVLAALDKLSLRREQVDVEIVSEGSRGFLGIGESPAKVLVKEKQWRDSQPKQSRVLKPRKPTSGEAMEGEADEDPIKEVSENIRLKITDIIPAEHKWIADKAKFLTMEIAEKTGAAVNAQHINWDDTQKRMLVDFELSNPHVFTSHNGEALDSFQYLVNLALAKDDITMPVRIDINYHWQKQERKVLLIIDKAVNTVKYTKKPFRMEPMSASMRKFVHKILENNPDVKTVSEGESKWRKVVIMPK